MTQPRALIEEELPLQKVNANSGREKYLHHGHIATMHRWWARRPLAMSRAVAFASLVRAPTGETERQQMLDELAAACTFEASAGTSLDTLRQQLALQWPDSPPRVLDCFAGGGAIPLEAARLGCEVTAADINPVAHLIQKAVLEFPANLGNISEWGAYELVEDFKHWADWTRRVSASTLSEAFGSSDGGQNSIFFWARTIPCPDTGCGRTIPIVSSRRLVDSRARKVRIDYVFRDDRIDLTVSKGAPKDGSDWRIGTKSSRGSSVTVTCPACGASRPDKELRAYARDHGFGTYLYAVLELRDGQRHYRPASPEDQAVALEAESALLAMDDFEDGTSAVPDESLVLSQYRRFPNITYGYTTWASMFTPRQRLVLATLTATVRRAHQEMLSGGMDAYRAKAIATYLSFAVSRIADYNSSFCGWDATNDKTRNTFPQQSIRMAWDFVEVNPFATISGSWDGAVGFIAEALEHCCTATAGNPSRVLRANAQNLPFPDGEFDAVIIDPPYYDAFQYGDLSDYFYVWLKRSIGHLYPDLFFTPLTPKKAEVIENRADKKSPEYISHEEFERRLQQAIDEVARVLKPEGVVSLVFAHTDVEAWEKLLLALRKANLVVTTSWPMRSEMASRPNALKGSVLASSVVLVCRKAEAGRIGFYDDVVRELDERIEERLAVFEEMQLVGADYFVSAIGPAFDVFARYERVERLSGEEVTVDQLIVLARRAVARHAMRRLLGGDTLSALDDRSLFYLTWRWAYDGLPIPADEAYMLCRAFDVELDQLTRSEALVRKEGSGGDLKYRLLGPGDRPQIELGVSPSLVDVMHLACRLHADGRRNELVGLLGSTGAGTEPGFWAMVSAITEALPDGNKERTMLLGLGGSRDGLTEAAAKHTGPAEALTFDLAD